MGAAYAKYLKWILKRYGWKAYDKAARAVRGLSGAGSKGLRQFDKGFREGVDLMPPGLAGPRGVASESTRNKAIVKNLDDYMKRTGNGDVFTDDFLMERQSIVNAGNMDLFREWAPKMKTDEVLKYIKGNVRKNVASGRTPAPRLAVKQGTPEIPAAMKGFMLNNPKAGKPLPKELANIINMRYKGQKQFPWNPKEKIHPKHGMKNATYGDILKKFRRGEISRYEHMGYTGYDPKSVDDWLKRMFQKSRQEKIRREGAEGISSEELRKIFDLD